MTANMNEAFSDTELDAVNGGYSFKEFVKDVEGAAEALRQGIKDGHDTAKQLLS